MEQSLDRQLDALKLDGAEEIIQEKNTGTKADRPELNRLLNILRKGGTLVSIVQTPSNEAKKYEQMRCFIC